jgi:outer membrane protein assembly factor BamB
MFSQFGKNVWGLKQISLLLIALVGCCFAFGLTMIVIEHLVQPETLPVYRLAEVNPGLKELWLRADIVVPNSAASSVATRGMFFIVGSLAQTKWKIPAILAFEASNGSLLWQGKHSLAFASALYATPSTLYAGRSNQLTAYDPRTGQTLWSNTLPSARNITHIYTVDNIIYVESTPGVYHLVQADTGEVLKTFKELPTATTLQDLKMQVETLPLAASLNPEYFRGIALTRKTKFYYKYPNGVKAIDIASGHTLWEIERGVVSTIAATEQAAYLLTQEGKLLRVNLGNGEPVTLIQFEPRSFPYSDPQGYIYVYLVAVDANAGLLYVYLGNSQQLFAFSLVDTPDP